jgi:hypothetical protein
MLPLTSYHIYQSMPSFNYDPIPHSIGLDIPWILALLAQTNPSIHTILCLLLPLYLRLLSYGSSI